MHHLYQNLVCERDDRSGRVESVLEAGPQRLLAIHDARIGENLVPIDLLLTKQKSRRTLTVVTCLPRPEQGFKADFSERTWQKEHRLACWIWKRS